MNFDEICAYFSQKIIILGFNDVFRWAQLTWDCSGPRICQGIGRPGAERYVAGDSANFSAKEFLYHPFSLTKTHFWSLLVKENGRKARFSPMSIALAHYIRLYVTCNAPCSRNIYCRKVFRDSVQISALFVFTSSKCRRTPGSPVFPYLYHPFTLSKSIICRFWKSKWRGGGDL